MPGEVISHPDGLEICHDEVMLESGQRVPIRVVVRVRIQGDEETRWEIEVVNQSNYSVDEVWFPLISGIQSLAGNPAEDHLIWPQTGGMRIPNPLAVFDAPGAGSTTNVGHRSYFATSPDWLGYSLEARRMRLVYPGRANMQWFGLYNDREGLYLGSYDTSRQTTALNLVKVDGHLSLSFIRYPFVARDEHWTSPPFVVAVDAGDWHAGARRYRRWADTWLRLPEVPRWIRDMDGWLLTFLKWPYGRINQSYTDIETLWEHTKAAGLNVMKINGWFPLGMDRGYPIFEADDDMGGEAALRSAIFKIRQEGGHVFLYYNGMIMDPDEPRVRPYAWEVAAKTYYGHPYVRTYNFFREGSIGDPLISGNKVFYMACQAMPQWRATLLTMVEQGLDLGADGLTFDQMGGLEAAMCFDKTHPHARPSDALGEPRFRNLMAMRKRMLEINPDAALETEYHCDAFLEACDIFVAPDINMAYGTLGFPELFLYTFPEVVLIKSHLDLDGLTQLHIAFTYGMKFGTHPGQGAGSLADYPRLTERIAYLVGLRNRYPDLLRNGRFVDTDWGKIDNAQLLAKGFINGDRLAVIIYNYTHQKQSYSLEIPGYRVEQVIPGSGNALNGSIMPNDLSVLICRKA
jgi:hypothetical protein